MRMKIPTIMFKVQLQDFFQVSLQVKRFKHNFEASIWCTYKSKNISMLGFILGIHIKTNQHIKHIYLVTCKKACTHASELVDIQVSKYTGKREKISQRRKLYLQKFKAISS